MYLRYSVRLLVLLCPVFLAPDFDEDDDRSDAEDHNHRHQEEHEQQFSLSSVHSVKTFSIVGRFKFEYQDTATEGEQATVRFAILDF